ncbi:MAG TPA: acyl-[ACP]--phospholipid O-acyltransferase [Hyphomicrobiaceae bacterium]|nr:acyl-[ACP]--phospholipid O-acyltransferase [Hyphomicrobiaceae bacterium]
MFTKLMSARRFAPLFWCQFFSALNDNILKNALGMLILFGIGTTAAQSPETASILITLSGVIMLAPFFILSALGGEIADRYDKGTVARWLKLAEIPVAVLAAIGFVMHSIPVLFVALAGFGIIGALFGPLKYGLLPEKLAENELAAGNALVEGATFLAILTGTILGGLAITTLKSAELVIGVVLVLAVLCWLSARWIPVTGPAAPDLVINRNIAASTFKLLGELKADRRLWTGANIVSWFWLLGFVVLSLLPSMIKDIAGGNELAVTTALALFTIGIATGSALAAKASHDRPNLSLVPMGALLMAFFCGWLAWLVFAMKGDPTSVITRAKLGPMDLFTTVSGAQLGIALFGLAASGGLFIVPAFAAFQSWAPADKRARVIASNNVLNAAYMVSAGAVVAGLQFMGVGAAILLTLMSFGCLVSMVLVLRAWGKEGVRDLARGMFQALLKLEVKGAEHLPKPGTRSIIAPNHVSLIDGPIMHAILPGHAAFAVDSGIAETWWAKPFLRLINAFTLDPTKPLAARSLVNLVREGQSLVIFPEGRITVTGGLMKVYDGTAMIADKADAVIVPVRIEGPERSPLGYMKKGEIRKALFPKTTVTVLPPRKLAIGADLKGKARRQAAGAALQDIMVDTAVETARLDRSLFEALVEARDTKATKKTLVEDPLGTKLTAKKLVVGAQVLGAKLAPLAAEGASVGVLLPNAAGVAVTFFALQSIGRVPAMLNFTAGAANIVSACRTARVEVVLTSRAFIAKGRLEPLIAKLGEVVKIVYLEDIRPTITTGDKFRGLLAGGKPQVARKPDDPAVVLFTSGSEGAPKGVVLSHRNLLANVAQCLSRISANGEDKVFNALPVFHSFGLTGGLLMPILGGIPVYLYPSPLHYRIVSELIYGTNSTIVFGTDTFLSGYARVAHPYDFHNVRLIMAGAEAVKDRTRQAYMERFGVRILEGYGVTETAPVLAMNTPLANKSGTVGRLSPLMEARLDPVPGITEGGRLFVRGPNVMLGYYRAENPGVIEPPAGGWHDTGDIVTFDAEGYIKIRGRAKRFAKIAGEMVSLSAIEALAAEVWPQAISVVVAEPDARKGERLVLMTQEAKATREAFQRHARARGATELMVPAEIMAGAAIPLLGSGKPDYVAAAEKARSRVRPAAPAEAEADDTADAAA